MGYTHPKEMIDRPCPNGWKECACCKHESDCRAGLYKGEEDITIAAEIADKAVIKEAIESAHKIKQTWHEWFMKLTPEESMEWFYANKVQGLHHKEPIAQDGPSAPGGGKSKNAKKPKKKLAEYLKEFAH